MENNPSFEYTYSARQQQELEAIRKKYLPRQEDKMDQLRKLDAQPGKIAITYALSIGILGALILGTGMSLFMTELGAFLGEFAMAAGVAVGLAGMVLAALAYPVYNRTLRKERQRIAPEVLRLTEELMQ